MTHSFSCLDVSFAWPDGDVVFDGLDLVAGPVRSGLVGRNGSGKSTLLRLVAGRLHPQRGTVQVSGQLGYLSQDLVLDTALHVDEVLGVAGRRRAIAAVERGDVDEAHFDTIGDDWGVEDRALATLGELGLGAVGLDHRVGELSGGQGVLLGLAAELLRRPDVLLLDEPTNNLDVAARRRLYSAVASWRGALLVVSHDRDLLELVDQIGELRDGEVTWYGGNLSAYEEAVAVEQEAAERVVRAAESDVRRQRRDLAEAQVKLSRRVRYGQKMWSQKREPKIVMGARRRQAQVSAGKHRNLHEERLATARESLADAEAQVHQDDDIRVDLPETEVPAGRRVLRLDDVRLRTGQTCTFELRGPERVALVGPNGAGKTTLLHSIYGDLDPVAGEIAVPVPARLLPQRLDLLDDTLSVVDNVARFAPDADNNTL
ncbi:MAG: ATP-binding cassette domain-containing protein, partial [Nocardioidaceae bacterium]